MKMRLGYLIELRSMLRKSLGINTHLLRYAYMTFLLKHRVSLALVAKITRHKTRLYINIRADKTQEKL